MTWGANTTHAIPSRAPGAAPSSGFAFGGSAPAPAPGGNLFGKPAAGSLFGGTTPAPAPASGGLFGTAPAPGGGLFGASPAPGGSMFGTPAPAPGGGLFGAAAPAPAFGAAPAPNPQATTPVIPEQAALQAHMEALQRQEQAKLQTKIGNLNKSYGGQNDKLCAIVYNPMSESQKEFVIRHQSQDTNIFIPPKPGQIDQNAWLKAVVNNPSKEHIPTLILGADGLQTRLGYQQQMANRLEQGMQQLDQTWQTMQQRSCRIQQDLKAQSEQHVYLQRRLLSIMQKVEIYRCMNLPIQEQEVELVKRLRGVLDLVLQQSKSLTEVLPAAGTMQNLKGIEIPEREQLKQVFEAQRNQLVHLSGIVETDMKDLNRVKDVVVGASGV